MHLFHTVHQRVWDYVNRFSEWMPYEHRVKGKVDGKLIPIPPSQETVNILFEANVHSEEEMEAWLAERRVKNAAPQVRVLNRTGSVFDLPHDLALDRVLTRANNWRAGACI